MFRNSNILVPTDFSTYANYALKYAVALAKQFGATLHYAHVLDRAALAGVRGNDMWLGETESRAIIESMREHATSRMAHLKQIADDEGIASHEHIVLGSPRKYFALPRRPAPPDRDGDARALWRGARFRQRVRRSCGITRSGAQRKASGARVCKDTICRWRSNGYCSRTFRRTPTKIPFASLAKQFDALVIFHSTEVPIVCPTSCGFGHSVGAAVGSRVARAGAKMCADIAKSGRGG